jgi:predicted Rossmann fold flavoprotein
VIQSLDFSSYDAVILGGGACGMMCAIQAGYLGKKTLIIEGNPQLGAKILISGGGRCNYTNLFASPEQFISQNPHFIRSALSQWSVEDTIQFFESIGVEPEEKTLGQLFPKEGNAKAIVKGFKGLLDDLGQDYCLNTKVIGLIKADDGFKVKVLEDGKEYQIPAKKVVIALGGLPIPKMGATDVGLQIAKDFQLPIVKPVPALVPLVSSHQERELYQSLMGISIFARVSLNTMAFEESILFTHWGLSGPAILQISSYYKPGDTIELNLLPNISISDLIKKERLESGKKNLKTLLDRFYAQRVSQAFVSILQLEHKNIADLTEKEIEKIHQFIHEFSFKAVGDKGYEKAEVMKGGVDTSCISSKTLECKQVPGLYLGGEVVDVTGWLGGYNFQWAWASGYVIAQHI